MERGFERAVVLTETGAGVRFVAVPVGASFISFSDPGASSRCETTP